jgi:Tol biopolymer transport system component
MNKMRFGLLVVLTLSAVSTVGCGVGSSTQQSMNPVFTKLAFISSRAAIPSTNLFLMNLDGSTVTPGPTANGSVYTPSVSADLRTIAYTLNGLIWTSKVDGSDQTQLTTTGYVFAVKLSPDGKKILFNQQDTTTNAYNLWIMNVDGSSPLNLTATMPAGMSECYGGSFSADSTKIAMNCEGNSAYGIYVIHPDGTGLTTVTNPTLFADTPVFTPDGTKILFVLEGQSPGVFSINLDGGNQLSIAPNGYETVVLNSILYYSVSDTTLGVRRIYTSNLDGTNAVALTDGTSDNFLGTATY